MSDTLRWSRRPVLASMVAFGLLLLLTACGGGPGPTGPDDTHQVTGSITLPAGHGVDLSRLSVSTGLGTYPVTATGAFEAEVLSEGASEIGVETASGELLLLGVSQGSNVTVTLTSTAEALLYYLVGGMWLPAEQQDEVRSLLRGVAEAGPVAAELQRQLMGGGNGVDAPDAGLLAALEAAHASLFADVGVAGAIVRSAVEGNNIIIDPSSTTQAGVQVLHNPSGAGVVAQNHYRRPAALLAYEVAWEDADHVETPIDPPVMVERVDVPATGQLEFLNALFDVVTGDSPWSPVLSHPVKLTGRAGASRTHYQLVLLGPTTSSLLPPIMADTRFAGFQDDWDEIITDKSLELFLDDLLLPLVEVYGLGSLAKYDAAKLSHMRSRVRTIADKHLLGLGVYLRQGRAGYADALKFAIGRLVESREFRLEMMDTVTEALIESDRNKVAIEAMEKRLATRASASGIAAAVQTLLVGGDVAKILHDLSNSASAVDWTAISTPALFALTPEVAVVSRDSASARFTVLPKGEATGTYVYRWSTSGTHGELSDLLHDGTSIETTSAEAWYFHDSPNNIEDTDVDTVSVEVFEVEAGMTSLPPGAQPIARMTATVHGDDRDIDSRIVVYYGSTSPKLYGKSYGCAAMYLRFAAVPGAKTYTVDLRNVGGQGHPWNLNQDFRLRGSNHTQAIDPNAKSGGGVHEDGYVGPWTGACIWKVGEAYALPPHVVMARYDAQSDEYLVHLFTVVATGKGSNPPSIAGSVPLWYDWVEPATFEVNVQR